MGSQKRGMGRVTTSLLNFRYVVIISSILFFALIGVAFFLVYQNAGVMRDQINKDFNDQQLILARQAASQIDANVHDIEGEIESLRRMCTPGTSRTVVTELMRAMLERTRSKGVMEIGLNDPRGALVGVHDAEVTKPVGSSEISRDCGWDEGGGVVLGPLRAVADGSNRLTVTSMLCRRVAFENRQVGVLFVRIDVSKLVANVTRSIRSGKTGYAWVIDETGMFLYHPEREFIGKDAFTARRERKSYISFVQINKIMTEQMLRGEEGTGVYVSGWHRGVQGEITKLIAFTPIHSSALAPGHMWSVAVVAPISEVAETVHRIYIRHFAAEVALVAGMFVFGLLAVIYQQRISRALKEQVKQTQENLEATEQIYQRVVEQAPDLIYILDLDMRIVLLNRHSVDTFSGLLITEAEGGVLPRDADLSKPEQFIGYKLEELMRPSDAAFMRRQIDQVIKTHSSLSYEHTIATGGKKVRLSTKLIPIRDDKGEVHHILGISRDVTEKMELDQRIYNAEKLASIGILAAGVAHEINNPLGVILGFTDLLLERFPPGSPEYEDLKIIEYNGTHAKKIVENLLAFARVTEGLEETVDVAHSMHVVMGIVRNTLMTKKIELVENIAPDVPRVRGDSREFQQVLFNLINNSVAAMENKGGTLTLSAWAEGGWVHVSVADTGIGIPDRIKPHIFDPFFTTKKVGQGTGLGLSLCYGIVTKYGGRITFTSNSIEDTPEKPSGTTFTVSMPAAPSPESGSAEGGVR